MYETYIEEKAVKALENILAADTGNYFQDSLDAYRIAQDALIEIREIQLKRARTPKEDRF